MSNLCCHSFCCKIGHIPYYAHNFFYRSVLVILLVKARDLPTNEANQYNYYIIINLFPQKHKPFQSAVYKTSSPGFGESFEFPIPSQYLLLQSLKFSLWSCDRFSHHDAIADTLVQLQELETYGLSIGRDVSLGKTLKLVQKASDYYRISVSFLSANRLHFYIKKGRYMFPSISPVHSLPTIIYGKQVKLKQIIPVVLCIVIIEHIH